MITQSNLSWYCITYGTAMTVAEGKSDFQLTIDTPYLALMGEPWGVYWEHLEKIDSLLTAPHSLSLYISMYIYIYIYPR